VGDLDMPEKLHNLNQKYLLIPSKTPFVHEKEDKDDDSDYDGRAHFSSIQTVSLSATLNFLIK
jgi:hypothetical protein